MYVPSHFSESNTATLHDVMTQHPFGMLVTHGRHGLDVNHLPFLLRPDAGDLGTLQAHVARKNPVWQDIDNGAEVLVVFRAGDAYVSPQWYPSKQAHHRQVPTWNYVVAHAHGTVTLHDDERFLRGLVGRLTRTHEAAQPVPWKMTDSPKEYIDAMLAAIVGIEIRITRLEGKAKLSQNKETPDIQGAGEALQALGHRQIGDAMVAIAAGK